MRPLINFFSSLKAYLLAGFEQEDRLTRNIYWLSLIALLLCIAIIVFLLLRRFYTERERKMIAATEQSLAHYLSSFLNSPDGALRIEIISELKKLCNRSYRQLYVRKEIVRLHSHLEGEAKQDLKNLYIKLGLHRVPLQQLKMGPWYAKIEAIREFAQLEIHEYSSIIQRYRNDIHPSLQFEVINAGFAMRIERPFEFLSFGRFLSDWQQINLLTSITNSGELDVPNFETYIFSTEPSIAMFAFRLMKTFQQRPTEAALVQGLHSTNVGVQKSCLELIASLQLQEFDVKLISLYNACNEDESCVQLLYCLEALGTSTARAFILECFSTASFQIKQIIVERLIDKKNTSLLQAILQDFLKNEKDEDFKNYIVYSLNNI